MAYESILKRLSDRELITPYLEVSIVGENWPDNYQITIDSGPYYGAGDGYFHPSSHPLMGARQLYYLFHPDHRDKILTERPTLKREMTLAMGSALHGVVQTQFQMTGLVGPDDVEVEYILEEQHVRGRIDFIVHHPNGNDYVVEMKTRLPWKFKSQDELEPSWDAQLSLAEYSQGKTEGILLLVESGWPYSIKELFHRRNDNLLDEVFEKFAAVRRAIAESKEPKYCCTFDSPTMKSCPARFQCWLSED
jgi:hypothetical protein